jgi:iron complex outermembrane receptor protein
VLGSSVLPELYPTGFQAYRRISERDFQIALGARGQLAGWDWDASSSFGRDSVWLGAENTLNPSIGPTSPTSFFMGRQIQSLWVNNLDLTHDYDIGLAKPVTVAVGFEHRWEKFQSKAGEPDSYRNGGYQIPSDGTPFGQLYGGLYPSPGLVSFTGTSPADAAALSRNNFAAYADISTNVTSRWYVGLAGRFEHYDDSAGNTLSGKVSTRYDLGSGFALRGGVNSGFRAPSLAQTGFSTTQNTSTIIGSTPTVTVSKFLPVDSAAALALGARAQAGKIAQLHCRSHLPARRAQPHGRCLSDPGRRPHRENRIPRHFVERGQRDPRHPARQRGYRRRQRAVLHQCHRHPHARH